MKRNEYNDTDNGFWQISAQLEELIKLVWLYANVEVFSLRFMYELILQRMMEKEDH
ncbi:MAG: hypothetical protein QXY90_02470 [Candidatus Anstonellales archaeon]